MEKQFDYNILNIEFLVCLYDTPCSEYYAIIANKIGYNQESDVVILLCFSIDCFCNEYLDVIITKLRTQFTSH